MISGTGQQTRGVWASSRPAPLARRCAALRSRTRADTGPPAVVDTVASWMFSPHSGVAAAAAFRSQGIVLIRLAHPATVIGASGLSATVRNQTLIGP